MSFWNTIQQSKKTVENIGDSNKKLSIGQITTETEKRDFHNVDMEDSSLLGCEAEKQSFIPDISKERTENVNGLCLRNVRNQ
jgi:hypothetical protein